MANWMESGTVKSQNDDELMTMVEKAAKENRLKWGVDEVTKTLCRGESELIVLCENSNDHKPLMCHLPAVANFKGVAWAAISPAYGEILSRLCGTSEPVLACTTTRPAPTEEEYEVESEEKTGKLNPAPFPLADFKMKSSLIGTVYEAFLEGKLVYDSIHEVTKAVAMGKSALVVIAADADPYENLLHLIPLAKYMEVPYVFAPSQEDLGFDLRKHLCRPISACCVTKTEGKSPLTMSLMLFRGALRACKHLPHWNGKPEIKIKPKALVRLVPPLGGDYEAAVDYSCAGKKVEKVQKVSKVEHVEEVVELGSFFEEV